MLHKFLFVYVFYAMKLNFVHISNGETIPLAQKQSRHLFTKYLTSNVYYNR